MSPCKAAPSWAELNSTGQPAANKATSALRRHGVARQPAREAHVLAVRAVQGQSFPASVALDLLGLQGTTFPSVAWGSDGRILFAVGRDYGDGSPGASRDYVCS